MTQSLAIGGSGFPSGYFVVKSIANGRVLDVLGDGVEDGTDVALWPEKESSLVENFRSPETNNQVFFIDTSGALCSRSSGHAIDIEDGHLVLRHRRPVSLPYPNAYSHPLPKFTYSQKSGEIQVYFECDPTYPSAPGSNAWSEKAYLLTAVPLRKPRTLIDNAADFVSTNIFAPIAMLTGAQSTSKAKPDEVFNGDIDLAEDEVVEEERGEEAEMDNSTEPSRKVTFISVPSDQKDMLDLLLSEKARNRRRWQVLPLRVSNAKTR